MAPAGLREALALRRAKGAAELVDSTERALRLVPGRWIAEHLSAATPPAR